MKKNIKNKRGEMTSTMLVTIILLAVGFGIILFLYSQLSFQDHIDRSVCHESVVLRATLPDSFELKTLVPLKCKSRKICITDKLFGKGECSSELGEDYDTIRVSPQADKREDQINQFVAREMAECWGMMGEGKVQIFTRDFELFQQSSRRCSICTRMSFDDSIKEKTKEIDGIGKYLLTHKVPNSDETYWNYLTSGISVQNYDSLTDVYSTDQKAIVFMESDKTDAPSWIVGILGAGTGGAIGCWAGAKGGAAIGAAVGSIVPGAGTLAVGVGGGLVGCIGGFVAGGIIGDYAGNVVEEELVTAELGNAEYVAGQFFMDYGGAISELGCESIESIP